MKYLFSLISVLLLLSVITAENYVVINSGNGLDVLSGIYYANVKGEPVKFMPLRVSTDLMVAKVGKNNSILLIQSKSIPANSFLKGELEKSNEIELFESVDPIDTNIKLAERSGTNKFIVVNPAFGQNALSVLSYAAKTKSYVLFVYSENVDKVVEFLDKVPGRSVTVFGYLDSKSKEKLSKYNPTYIGKGEDKYEDNTIIVDRTLKISPTDMIIISDGTFLAENMVDGSHPVVLISRLVPTVTYNFLKEKVKNGEIKGAYLVGNYLQTPALDLRNRLNNDLQSEGSTAKFGVITLFGQAVGGGQVQSIDTFPLPYYVTGLTIESVKYNKASNKIEVVVRSKAEGPEYYQTQLRIKVNGQEVKVIDDPSPRLLEANEVKGTEYDYTLPEVEEGNIVTDVIVRYGETSKSLSNYEFVSTILTSISFNDVSDIEFVSASYDNLQKYLHLSIRNTKSQDAYVMVSAVLNVNGQPTKINADGVRRVEKGAVTVVSIPVTLTKEDLSANKEVKVIAQYGAREGFLKKTKEATLPLSTVQEGGMDPLLLVLIVLIVVLLITVIYFATRRRK